MPTVSFSPSGKSVTVPAGASLLEAVRSAGFHVSTACGSKGLCGKCRVRIIAGEVAADGRQRACLWQSSLDQGWRASCVAAVTGDLLVEDPAHAADMGVVLTDFVGRYPRGDSGLWAMDVTLVEPSTADQGDDASRLLAALARGGANSDRPLGLPLGLLRALPGVLRENSFQCRVFGLDDAILSLGRPGTTGDGFGLAIDIGTTTLAAALCDLRTLAVLSVASGLNPQSRHGDDVISRADYACRGGRELAEMRSLVVDALSGLCRQAMDAAGVGEEPLLVTVAANPIMSHLFLGVSPGAMAVSPFVPAFRDGRFVAGNEIGWTGPGNPLVYVLPAVSAYVGGDIVAGLLAHDAALAGGAVLFLDVGTNGEMALAVGGKILACATAAGPAFEGARITQGMRAAPGAVARVAVGSGGRLDVEVVDGAPARGLCGTGLLDAVATLLGVGLIDQTGRLLDADEARDANPAAPAELLGRIHDGGGGPAVWLARPGEKGSAGVALAQRDIREFQLAKGAVAAGARVLLDRAGLEPAKLDAVLLAGGFGNYLDPKSALATGLIPAGVALERIRSVGNAALAGSRLCLLARDERAAAETLARRVEYIELSGRDDFQVAFAEEMLFGGDDE